MVQLCVACPFKPLNRPNRGHRCFFLALFLFARPVRSLSDVLLTTSPASTTFGVHGETQLCVIHPNRTPKHRTQPGWRRSSALTLGFPASRASPSPQLATNHHASPSSQSPSTVQLLLCCSSEPSKSVGKSLLPARSTATAARVRGTIQGVYRRVELQERYNAGCCDRAYRRRIWTLLGACSRFYLTRRILILWSV